MVEIIELPLSDFISTQYSIAASARRSPGPHLKVIVDDYCAYHGLGRAKNNPDFVEALDRFALMGFAWERVVTAETSDSDHPLVREALSIIRHVMNNQKDIDMVMTWEEGFGRALTIAERQKSPRTIVYPGEVTVDGIHCNADACDVVFRGGVEWKCAWASANGSLMDEYYDWYLQVSGYAYAYNWDRYRIFPFYVNGTYEKYRMGKPVIRPLELRWHEDELAELWALITGHKALMEAQGKFLLPH